MNQKLHFSKEEQKKELIKILRCLIGATLYAGSINIFITPVNLYNGGIMGFSQLLQIFLVDVLKLPLHGFNLTGIIYYIFNIPILLLSFNKVGKRFFVKSVICISWITFVMSLIPVPSNPLLEGDLLGTCIIGGLIGGYGVGTMLKMGGSGGGMDIVGMMLVKWKKDFSVGKINLFVNSLLYAICFFLFNIPIVIYSFIYASISSIAIDRVHDQTITVEATIITKMDCPEMRQEIFNELRRGITLWNATGAYTNEDSKIMYVLLSKYEVRHLKNIVKKYDPNAFIVVNEGVQIQGNYQINL